MRYVCGLPVIVIFGFLLVLPFPQNAQASLQNGVPFDTYLDSMTYANIDIYVPAGATKLTVTISNGSGNLDLYLKYGSPAQGNTVGQLNANADVVSAGPTADETIVLTPETTPPLHEGVWYVATLNLNNTRTYFALTATVEVPMGQAIPIPTEQEMWGYSPVEKCIANYDAASSKPICIQTSVPGGKTITVKVEAQRFAAPVDIYFGICANPIDSRNIYLLSSDNHLRPLAEGYVPWRTNVAGPLNENVLGDIPLSSLPPGRYDLYLGIALLGRTDVYYIWATSYVIKPGPEYVADGDAAFFDGTVVVPKSKIQFQGQLYDETAEVPANTLVGVIKSDKIYLYHTALGTVTLSDETTRKAIGQFVMDYFENTSSTATAGLNTIASGDQLLTYANPADLKTGVKLTRLAEKEVEVLNEFHRWAAIEGTEGSGPYFLPPPARYLDNNLIRLFGNYLKLSESWFNASNENKETVYFTSDSLTIETFGATWRPLPYFLAGATDIANMVVSLLSGRSNPVTNIPIDGEAMAIQKDQKLVEALWNIDLAAMLFEGIKLFAATFDVSETLEPVVNLCCNTAMAITHAWINGQAGTPQAKASVKKAIEDLANDIPTALINVGTAGGGTPFFTLVDGIATLDYMVEDVVIHDLEVTGGSAYDEVSMKPETSNNVDLFSFPWRVFWGCDETSTSCDPVPNYLKFYTNYVYDLFASPDMAKPDWHGSWSRAGSTLTLTPTDGKDCVSSYVGTLIYPHTIKGYYTLGPKCANPGEKHYWMAQ